MKMLTRINACVLTQLLIIKKAQRLTAAPFYFLGAFRGLIWILSLSFFKAT